MLRRFLTRAAGFLRRGTALRLRGVVAESRGVRKWFPDNVVVLPIERRAAGSDRIGHDAVILPFVPRPPAPTIVQTAPARTGS